MNELRLKRHETFSIRYGWLEKGLNIISKDPFCFRKDDGPKNFGLGTNMVKSLKYWLMACSLIEYTTQNGAILTETARFLLRVDPYLENDFSWWLIHYNLVANKNGDTPVINAYFNMDQTKIEKGSLFTYLKDKFENEYGSIGSENSLESDIQILFKSYYSDDSSNPENNMNCPLGKLGLVNLVDRKVYLKTNPPYSKLNYKLVYYALINCINEDKKENISLNLEDIFTLNNNPLKFFNITKTMFLAYLDEMKKNGLISLVKTAGLNVVTIEKIKSLQEIYDL